MVRYGITEYKSIGSQRLKANNTFQMFGII